MNKEDLEYRIRKVLKEEKEELKPCPFCGKTPELYYSIEDFFEGDCCLLFHIIRTSCCPIIKKREASFFNYNFDEKIFRVFLKIIYQYTKEWNERRIKC